MGSEEAVAGDLGSPEPTISATSGRSLEVRMFGAAFFVRLVPWLFFVLWPGDPLTNPLVVVSTAHAQWTRFAYDQPMLVIPVLMLAFGLFFWFMRAGLARKVCFFLLYYLILTPPMTALGWTLRQGDMGWPLGGT